MSLSISHPANSRAPWMRPRLHSLSDQLRGVGFAPGVGSDEGFEMFKINFHGYSRPSSHSRWAVVCRR